MTSALGGIAVSCRETHAGSALTSFARRMSGLTDTQVQNAFHDLKADGKAIGFVPDPDQWRTFLQEQYRLVENSALAPAQRQSIQERLVNALKQSPDAATWHALQHLHTRTQSNAANIDRTLVRYGRLLGHGPEAMRRWYPKALDAAAQAKTTTDPTGYTPEARTHLKRHGLPTDRVTWQVMTWLHGLSEERQAHATDETAEDARRCATCGQFTVPTHTCPDHTPSPASPVLGDTATSRPLQAQTLDGLGLRCQPVLIRTAGGRHAKAHLPEAGRRAGMNRLRASARQAPVLMPMLYERSDRTTLGTVTGQVTGDIELDHDGHRWTCTGRNLRCTCPDYQRRGDCLHLTSGLNAYSKALIPEDAPARTINADIEDADAQARVQEALDADWARHDDLAHRARQRWPETPAPVSYSDDFAVFEEAVAHALSRHAAGQPVFTYATEQATDGVLSRASGRGFGVELEFTFPGDWDIPRRRAALEAIGAQLHERGLTRHSRQDGEHASKDLYGYSDTHRGGWAFERDGTVDGEVVSPIMYDEPQTWQNLATVCDIIRKNGGGVSTRAGLHVHVGLKHATAAVGTELEHTVNAYEDVLYRLSAQPGHHTHRPLGHCRPNPVPPPGGYHDTAHLRAGGGGRTHALNVNALQEQAGDHAELRHWDATLDPATIQVQVKMSAALVASAERNAHLGSAPLPREPLGAHYLRQAALLDRNPRALTSRELCQDTATTRALIDTLFHRPEDKAQAAALFALTRWQRPDPTFG